LRRFTFAVDLRIEPAGYDCETALSLSPVSSGAPMSSSESTGPSFVAVQADIAPSVAMQMALRAVTNERRRPVWVFMI
jgi:hypothetical protein